MPAPPAFPRERTRSLRIGAGIGAGVGMLPGMSHCYNEGGSNCIGGSLGYYPYPAYAALAGLGIGAAVGALRGK